MNYESTITSETAESIQSGYDRPADLADVDTQRSFAWKRWMWIGLGILGLLLAVGAFLALTVSPATDADDSASRAPSVTVVSPGQTQVEGMIVATGTIAARREMPVGVVGEGGRVVSVTVEQGDWVYAGQVLASIDRSVQSQQARSAAAQIQVAKADAELAQANLARALQLVERGFVSKADVDRLTATRDAARARVAVAEAQYNELLARNARLNIVAPAAGLLLERNVEPGQTVGAGSGTLFSIARGGEMELLAQVSESQLASLSAGMSASVVPTGSEKTFTGQIWQLSPVIDPQSRQGTARIALAYAPGLRPGGFATAQISSGTIAATVLPESAVLADDSGSYVYIIDDQNKAVRRPVKTGMVTPQGIAIIDGLTGDERVVLRAGGFLNPGETVNPQKAED